MAIPSHYTRENSEYNLRTHFTYNTQAETLDIGEMPIRDREENDTVSYIVVQGEKKEKQLAAL